MLIFGRSWLVGLSGPLILFLSLSLPPSVQKTSSICDEVISFAGRSYQIQYKGAFLVVHARQEGDGSKWREQKQPQRQQVQGTGEREVCQAEGWAYGWGMGASGLMTMHTHSHLSMLGCRCFKEFLFRPFRPGFRGAGVDSGVCGLVCRAGGWVHLFDSHCV